MKNTLFGILTSLLLTAVSSFFLPAAQAFYEVHDSDNIAQAIQQVAYQSQQVQMQLQNLANMDQASAAANMAQIQQQLQQLVQLQQEVQGMTLDYQATQEQWNQLYGTDYSNMNNTDFAEQAQKLSDQTNKSIYDAMRAQGLVSQIGTDSANLQSLLQASQSAQGALAAAQVGSQIAALQAQQLMRLQQIMAQSNQAQAAYYAEQKQKEAMAKESTSQYFQRN